MDKYILGKRIQQRREARQLTQADFADTLGISTSALNSIESGYRSVDAIGLLTIARLLGSTPDELLAPAEGEADSDKWKTEWNTCAHCGNRSAHVHPIEYDAPNIDWLECPQCGFRNYPEDKPPEAVHIVVSLKNGATAVTATRRIDVYRLVGILSDAQNMLLNDGGIYLDPDIAELKVALSILQHPGDDLGVSDE